ncbi:MAG: hypothetical protein ACHQ4G_04630 [Opitutales bacterium]
MPHDPHAEFDHTVLDLIEQSPIGAVPSTPAYQDALKRLYASRQVYAHADHKGGHVTARSLAGHPLFHPANLTEFVAGQIADEDLETSASIYDRYVRSLPSALQTRAESHRVTVIGKAVHHRAKHGATAVHDPMHMLFLVPGAGPHPGLPGNYLHGSVFHLGADEASGSWVIHLHDSDDGMVGFAAPARATVLTLLQDVLASAPFHLEELAALGFVRS